MPRNLARREASQSPRKATNISLDPRLLREAKRLGVNISRACELGLAEQIAKVQAQLWLEENHEAIGSSNSYADKRGLPLAAYRQF